MPKQNTYILEIAVFTCGMVVMIYELLGSRLIAPYLGNSIYSWSTLIGVILLSLSTGYWLGGRLADKKADTESLSFIILMSSVCVTITLLIQGGLLEIMQYGVTGKFFGLGTANFISDIILFAPASIFLGMVSPIAVKLKLTAMENAGKTVGNLYALSTLGSITGTFAAGYLLIPYFGTAALTGLLAFTLLFIAALINPHGIVTLKRGPLYAIVLGILILFFSARTANARIIDIDTAYNRVWITDGNFGEGGDPRPVRWLMTNPFSVQTGMFLDDPNELYATYLKFFTLTSHFMPQAKDILMIGGGAFGYARYHGTNDHTTNLDIVEIDPKLTDIAKEYFFLKDYPNVKIINEDSRIYINTVTKRYDAILLDAYGSIFSIPFPLTTIQAVQKYYDLLNKDGIVMANIISTMEGDRSDFLRAEYATFKKIFPQVYLFRPQKKSPKEIQGVVLLALKSTKLPSLTPSPDQKYGNLLTTLWTQQIQQDLPILTDDHAPVDEYIQKLLE